LWYITLIKAFPVYMVKSARFLSLATA
jgi:hypothetical protein